MFRKDKSIMYEDTQEIAYKVLRMYSDGQLPIDPFKIISKIKNVKIFSYHDYAQSIKGKEEFKDFTIGEIISTIPSKEGFSCCYGRDYVIFYNEKMPIARIKWTLFHEMGHHFLEHLKEDYCQKRFFNNEKQYEDVLEKEANNFARHCSSPLPIAYHLYLKTFNINKELPELFKYYFDMSEDTSKICSKHFDKHLIHYITDKHKFLVEFFKKSIGITARNLHLRMYINQLNDFLEILKHL